MIRTFACCTLCLVWSATVQAEVQTKNITYKLGGVEFRGFLAWDDKVDGARPGVLVVHEWWGLNDYARARAEQLAKLGYVAFAADMYGEGKTVSHPKEAGEMASKVRSNVHEWRERAKAALDVLKSQPQCDKSKLAAIGYCFGGSTVLQLALSGADVDVVASFHGALPDPNVSDVKQAKAHVLVFHGADDPFIPEANVKKFREAMDKGGANYDFVAYPGARHSFTVPDADSHGNAGMKYDKKADEDSWNQMKKVFAEKLKRS